MRFDGDIIITDPCYIINKDNDDSHDENGNLKSPSWWDFVSKTTFEEVTQNGRTFKRYKIPQPEDYPDCREKTIDDCKDDLDKKLFEIERLLEKNPKMFSPTLQAEWDAYHMAEDLYNEVPHDDWERCEYGYEMEALGFKTYLTSRTIYGDWSCTTFDSDTKEPIGNFCADAGMVGVFLLSDVLKYNPHYNDHIKSKHAVTLINDFHGDINITVNDETVNVVGKGNINFITKQTGF